MGIVDELWGTDDDDSEVTLFFRIGFVGRGGGIGGFREVGFRFSSFCCDWVSIAASNADASLGGDDDAAVLSEEDKTGFLISEATEWSMKITN